MLSAVMVLLAVSACSTPKDLIQPYSIVENAHSGGNALAIHPGSQVGASGGWSGRVRLWRLADASPIGGWLTGHGDLHGLLFLDDDRLLTAGYDGNVRVWSLDGSLVRIDETGAPITSFRASRDRTVIMLGHNDGRVSLWKAGGERIASWQLTNRRITAVAVSDDLQRLASADSSGRVWRWERSDDPTELDSTPSYMRSLLFMGGGETLIGSGWFHLFSWDGADAAFTKLPTDHHGIINQLEAPSDGSYVASISRQTDSAILLLNPDSGQTLRAFRKHDLCGQRIVLSPDSKTMMSNSDDASVRFYRLPELEAEH